MSTTESPEHLSADQVAIRLGISIQSLRKLRREILREGEHWMRDPADDRRTLFTPGGIQIIRAHVGAAGPHLAALVSPEPEKPQDAPVASPVQPVLEETLTVVSSPRVFPEGEVKHHPNPRVISARRANNEVVYVRVPESRHFIAKTRDGSPMVFRARFEGNPPNWSLIGRCPRWLGRW